VLHLAQQEALAQTCSNRGGDDRDLLKYRMGDDRVAVGGTILAVI